MQRFSASDAKYAYSPDHASIGTVQPGERFEVESVEGFSNYFRDPSDFTPEVYARAEAVKWAVTGPISVAGAEANGAVAVTIHAVDVVTPGVVVGAVGVLRITRREPLHPDSTHAGERRTTLTAAFSPQSG